MDIDLHELAKQAVEEAINASKECEVSEEKDCVEHNLQHKVKIITSTGLYTYDALKGTYKKIEGKDILENKLNEFLNSIDSYLVQDISVSVNKNFLPHTTAGEYEELWIACVHYFEDLNE